MDGGSRPALSIGLIALKKVGISIKNPKHSQKETPQIMIEPPWPYAVPTWHAGSIASWAWCHILNLLSALNNRNRDSSSVLLVSSPIESILSILLPRQDVQPDSVHWAVMFSWVCGCRSHTVKWALYGPFTGSTTGAPLIQLVVIEDNVRFH